MLNPPTNAIKIIECMCSNPYINSGGMRVMKRGANQMGKDESQIELGKLMKLYHED